jgi:hypothetical protein
MGIWRRIGLVFCGLTCILVFPAGAGATPGSGSLPEKCTFEEGDLGHYIVVFHDWVEDPEAVAHEQVKRYGGNLGHVYIGLKGYAAEYLPYLAEALQAEPTVKRIDIDALIWMDESSGVIQWRSCPLAPPLGPPPLVPPDLPGDSDPTEEVEPTEASGRLEPTVGPPAVSPPVDEMAGPGVDRCNGKTKRAPRCGSKQSRRNACRKRGGRVREPALAQCPRIVRGTSSSSGTG